MAGGVARVSLLPERGCLGALGLLMWGLKASSTGDLVNKLHHPFWPGLEVPQCHFLCLLAVKVSLRPTQIHPEAK